MSGNKNDFAGDVLLVSTADGADLVIEGGLVRDCRDFSNAAYLSLFGGNADDLNGRPKETWWGNLIAGTKESEQIRSEFGAMTTGLPLTSGNLQKARAAAERDLEWIKKEAGADKISVSLSAKTRDRIDLKAEVKKDGSTVAGGEYESQWTEVA